MHLQARASTIRGGEDWGRSGYLLGGRWRRGLRKAPNQSTDPPLGELRADMGGWYRMRALSGSRSMPSSRAGRPCTGPASGSWPRAVAAFGRFRRCCPG